MKIFRNALNSSMQRKLVLITANLIKNLLLSSNFAQMGKSLKILITNVVANGLIADKKGYRYEKDTSFEWKKLASYSNGF